MLNSIKTNLIVGAIAAGSLAAGSAQAQSVGWNVIRPTGCFVYDGPTVNGIRTSYIDVYTNTFTVTLRDPGSVNIASNLCLASRPFWSYNTGGNNWTWVYFSPYLN